MAADAAHVTKITFPDRLIPLGSDKTHDCTSEGHFIETDSEL